MIFVNYYFFGKKYHITATFLGNNATRKNYGSIFD